jgi:hypothetical protein
MLDGGFPQMAKTKFDEHEFLFPGGANLRRFPAAVI